MTRVPRAIRRLVQQRAEGRCEYCRTPEAYRLHAFQVEHIRPVKHGGKSTPENLAWSCLHRNLRKGTDLTAYDDFTNEIVPLFNPRSQDWHEHFEIVEAIIVGKTPTGRATTRLLQLNHPDQVDTRRTLLQANLW